uniref:DJ-1/PfpI domain-containing protein n=1 Tax=Lotharella oceanica TaxID=641309 RepID=A0A7S2X669_9EUKA|mmetsp:Transcript_11595/g.22325  ORF Transcript_11595/g.22325 Transcript_11595/m.22325 type:complete len:161 (+) Transcript_11595:253-735(+)
MSRGMTYVADVAFDALPTGPKDVELSSFSMVVLPGGFGGAQTFAKSSELLSVLKHRKAKGLWYAAICASPALVLHPNALLPKHATCYPALHEKITKAVDEASISSRVVVDAQAKCVTSQGPGTTLEFAVRLVALLRGNEIAKDVAEKLLLSQQPLEEAKL